MAVSPTSKLIQHLRGIAFPRDGGGFSDGQLLDGFIRLRDEAALAALVRRHGPMVWGVCRRILRSHHDAEDAFQATFLVLVRKAASVVPREMVANWLYGVARQTALKARATAARRSVRERQATGMPEPAAAGRELWRDLQPLLDEELGRLPDKYRIVVVLCDLEGKTRKEAAGQLGCPEGTVAGRLARARAMLAKRLARHGLVVSGGMLAAVLSQNAASAGVPPSVLSSTIKAASLFAAGRVVAAGAISPTAAALTEGVLKTMSLSKLKVVVTLSLGLLILGSVGGVLAQKSVAQQRRSEAAEIERGAASKDDNLKNTLMALDKALWDAFAKGDPTLAQKLYADDFVSFSPYGRYVKKDALDSIRRYRPRELKIRDVELLRVNKNTAILTYVYDVDRLTPNGQLDAIRRSHLISHCWAQRDGGWVMVFAQDFIQPGGE